MSHSYIILALLTVINAIALSFLFFKYIRLNVTFLYALILINILFCSYFLISWYPQNLNSNIPQKKSNPNRVKQLEMRVMESHDSSLSLTIKGNTGSLLRVVPLEINGSLNKEDVYQTYQALISFKTRANMKNWEEFQFNDSPLFSIKVNQVGYYSNGAKYAIIPESNSDEFFIIAEGSNDTVFKNKLTPYQVWPYSKEKISLADFSELNTNGRFFVYVKGLEKSFPFNIDQNPHSDLLQSSIKSYYYQRSGIDILPKYGGKWIRKKGHPDEHVIVHESVVSDNLKTGSLVNSTGGWYDAGDYNKYIVPSAIAIHNLFLLLNHNVSVQKLKLNIPESNNNIPDLLSEILYNLRWMLKMQDSDGGVFHKVTTPEFALDVMPENDKEKRYLIQKTTIASLDYAASMAIASRSLRKYKNILPGLEDSCLNASRKAWNWALKNPDIKYNQSENNVKYKPSINTGEYCLNSENFKDEFFWAAAELFLTTNNSEYLSHFNLYHLDVQIPVWDKVIPLGFISLAFNYDHLPDEVKDAVKQKIMELGNKLMETYSSSPYKVSLGAYGDFDFEWKTNTMISNQGIVLMSAYRITSNKKYLEAASGNLDYLLGKNPNNYCFVTGFGSKSPKHIHHRISKKDGILPPIPGLMVSGAQKLILPQNFLEKNPPLALRYSDLYECFHTNEIAINQNSALVLLAGLIQQAYETDQHELTMNK